MGITWRHMMNIKKDNVTLQYPEERWPRPERDIGFEHEKYNVIRSRLHVDIDDCIGCLKCERACPVDCIKIDTIKAPTRGEDIPDIRHTGVLKMELIKPWLSAGLRSICLNAVTATCVFILALRNVFIWWVAPIAPSIPLIMNFPNLTVKI